jgi:hypothetical protein
VSGDRVIHPWKCVQRASQCLALLVIALGVTTVTRAEEFEMITLPAPQTTGGKPLMEALGERRSTREFSPRALPIQILSDLLWAATGVNRPESGKRTAPSARDWREIDIYVVTAEGVWRYDADAHLLRVEIPADYQAIKSGDPGLALEWRLAMRQVFEAYFAAGYTVVDFGHKAEGDPRSFYILRAD